MPSPETAADQAAGLRRMAARPVRVLAVTSGKGGVGKTNVSVNLSVALSQLGRRVMLLDADLGLANVDVLLGLQPRHNLSHVLSGERTLAEILVDGPAGIRIVPAASGVKHMAELSAAENSGLVQAFSALSDQLDVLVIDTAAGIHESVLTFCRAAQEVLIVVCDEPTSITDAYALIKVLSREYGVGRFRILANMAHGAREGEDLFAKITRVTDRFLDVTLDYVGSVPWDVHLRKAVQKQRAVVEAHPSSKVAGAFRDIALRIDRWPAPAAAAGHLSFFFERLVEAATARGGAVL